MLPHATAILLFDLDGVVRDVSASYRRAIQATVRHYSGWTPEESLIDALKGEGRWNNDWLASLELLRRRSVLANEHGSEVFELPSLAELTRIFSGFYFGADPGGPSDQWTGFIRDEPLLVDGDFFTDLTREGVAWGFVSGAEPPSARFLLESRLGLVDPPLVAMGEAPDKPDPTGLLRLAGRLASDRGQTLGPQGPPVAYLGDTVADIETVRQARLRRPDVPWLALAVAPPHLHASERLRQRNAYEERLLAAGADHLLNSTAALRGRVLEVFTALLAQQG
ncbi:MAG: TIGR01548 family HAD-type hydrolase [Cyanobacteriota bacterium]|nr:TIGR01548 family HAD-type hydrolase [Cyanobacteriota bacterium]